MKTTKGLMLWDSSPKSRSTPVKSSTTSLTFELASKLEADRQEQFFFPKTSAELRNGCKRMLPFNYSNLVSVEISNPVTRSFFHASFHWQETFPLHAPMEGNE
ncbi:hypothetical protein Dimus_037074 [Dionaea muscipula]